jgi:hypothetical protein
MHVYRPSHDRGPFCERERISAGYSYPVRPVERGSRDRILNSTRGRSYQRTYEPHEVRVLRHTVCGMFMNLKDRDRDGTV